MVHTEILKGPDAFFMGASTGNGFYSLFDGLCDPAAGDRLCILKGGPGTGKSSMLGRIARAADAKGIYCQRIHCSSDPDSLDAVLLPGLGFSAADGTAPHVLEPAYPGVCETLADLGAFRNDALLRENAEAVIRLTRENREAHARCAAFLKGAAAAEKELRDTAGAELDREKTDDFAARLAAKELGAAASHPGKVSRRFLTALTPKGVTAFYCTVRNVCDRVILLEDEAGAAAARILAGVAAAAKTAGCDAIVCLSPFAPGDAAQLLLPDRRLAICTVNRRFAFPGEAARTVRCGRFYAQGMEKRNKNRFAFCRKASDELLEEALRRLRDAKGIHDALERYYTAAMDFDAQNEYVTAFIRKLGL